MKKPFALVCLSLIAGVALSQDTLKIMTYNLLDYNAADNSRDRSFCTVLRHVRPDLIVAQELSHSSGSTQQASVDSFYRRVVNVVFPGEFSKGTYIPDPNDTGNEIFYKPSQFAFVANTPIHTILRDISEFKLYNATAVDTFRIYSVHLKASQGFETDRGAEIDSLRKVTNRLPTGKYFIVAGDYNTYSAAEPAYQKLLQVNQTDDGYFLDALHSIMTGSWHQQPQYSPYYTQSSRGGSFGGLDDRFDMILYSRAVSQPGKIQYLAGSLTPIGNDGNHYNDSINRLPNAAVPDSVANALAFASDHLPVSARFVFTPGSASNATITASAGPNGFISPGGLITVSLGTNQTFAMSPDTGYHVDSIVVDGSMAGSASMYTFTNIQSDHSIRAVFAIDRYTITALADSHGTISPNGPVSVTFGSNQIFTVLPDSGYQVDSLFVDGALIPATTSYEFVHVTANHNIRVAFRGTLPVIRSYGMQGGWNLVSLPLTVSDRRKVVVFPSAESQAYCFLPASGYVVRDSLENGVGYWLQFPSQQNVSISGFVRTADTVEVTAGWNLIGSTSIPVAVTSVQQDPPAIVSTPYYGYSGGYSASDTLKPASGYWVRISQTGRLILR